MGVSEGVTVVGSEEVMRDASAAKAMRAKSLPHPLAVARLEVMRPSVRPDIDAVEPLEQLLEAEEEEPYVQDEELPLWRRGARWCECVGSEAMSWDAFSPICARGSLLFCSSDSTFCLLRHAVQRVCRSSAPSCLLQPLHQCCHKLPHAPEQHTHTR